MVELFSIAQEEIAEHEDKKERWENQHENPQSHEPLPQPCTVAGEIPPNQKVSAFPIHSNINHNLSIQMYFGMKFSRSSQETVKCVRNIDSKLTAGLTTGVAQESPWMSMYIRTRGRTVPIKHALKNAPVEAPFKCLGQDHPLLGTMLVLTQYRTHPWDPLG